MPALLRFDQKLFGTSASTDQMAQFGSLAAGSPVRYDGSTVTPALIQALSRYLEGWFSAVIDGSSPAIEDMNSICYLFAYQLAYVMERGVPQWSPGTTYWIGSIAQVAGQLFVSQTDNNLNNNPLTDSADWKIQGQGVRTTGGSGAVTVADDMVRGDPTAGNIVLTIDAVATFPIGHKLILKNVATNGNTVTLASADGIDQAPNYVLNSGDFMDSLTLSNNGSGWDII